MDNRPQSTGNDPPRNTAAQRLRPRTKLLIAASIVLAVAAVALIAGGYLFLSQPRRLKPLLARSIGNLTGAQCTIDQLRYTLKPLEVSATGITLSSATVAAGTRESPPHKVLFSIPELKVNLALEGTFGHKTLVLTQIHVERPDLLIDAIGGSPGQLQLFDFGSHATQPSFWGKLIRPLSGFLLFKTIRFESGQIVEGRFRARWGSPAEPSQLKAGRMQAHVAAGQPVSISMGLEASLAANEIRFTAPAVIITSQAEFDFQNLQLQGTLKSHQMAIHSPAGMVPEIDFTAGITYEPEGRRLRLKQVQFNGTGVAVPDDAAWLKGLPYTRLSTAAIAAQTELDLDLNERILKIDTLRARVEGLQLLPKSAKAKEQTTQPLNLAFETTGRFDANRRELTLSRLLFDIPQLVELNGALMAGLGHAEQAKPALKSGQFDPAAPDQTGPDQTGSNQTGPNQTGSDQTGSDQAESGQTQSLRLQLEKFEVWPVRVRPLLPSALQQRVTPYYLSGRVNLSGYLAGRRNAPDSPWEWQTDMKMALPGNRYRWRQGHQQVKGRLKAKVDATGTWPDITLQAALDSAHTSMAIPALTRAGVATEPFRLRGNINGRYPQLNLSRMVLQSPGLTLVAGGRRHSFGNLRARLPRGSFNGKDRQISLPGLRLDSNRIKNLTIDYLNRRGRTEITVRGQQTALVQTAASFGYLGKGWRLGGRDDLFLKAVQHASRPVQAELRLGLKDFEFENAPGSVMGEKVNFEVHVKGDLPRPGSGSPAKSPTALTATLTAGAGEVLLDRYYLNLNRNPVKSSSRIELVSEGASSNIRLSDFKLNSHNLAALETNGTIKRNDSGTKIVLTVAVAPTPLAPLFRHLVQEPFGSEKPMLARLVATGSISGNFDISGSRPPGPKSGRPAWSWQAYGHAGWRQGGLKLASRGIDLTGIQLKLPVWYRSPRKQGPIHTLTGSLKIGSVRVPLLPEQSLNLPLVAGPNRFTVVNAIPIRTPGGKLKLGPTRIRNAFDDKFNLQTRLVFDSIALPPLLAPIWKNLRSGEISGNLSPIRYQKRRLTSTGEITARVFGGLIRFTDLGAGGMFTAAPTYKLNVNCQDLHLTEMTAGTAFGKIEGILAGHIRSLEFAYGQPQRFNLLLETVRRRKIPQKISVAALDNIARLGGGQSPFMGMAGGFATLFKNFSYKKIGIRANLANDVIRINGTINEGGKEYIVKRSGLSGVNVINHNPQNSIGFKDMVKRIKRIASPKKGVVKKGAVKGDETQ